MRTKTTVFFGWQKLFVSACAFVLAGGFLWAGDTAVFVDLGFSPDGQAYMFGQYGVHAGTLKPWAEICVVDVPANSFVPGGKISYTHDGPITSGQDGSGALYQLISRTASLANRHNIDYLLQGQPLYISMENGVPADGETVEFRDFEKPASFRARMSVYTEGSGEASSSSFYIDLERDGGRGAVRNYIVGNARLKRAGITGYRIRKVVVVPGDGSIVFVIEMKQYNAKGGYDLRYMVETLRL